MYQIVWGDIFHAEDNWKVLESLPFHCYTSFPTGCRMGFPLPWVQVLWWHSNHSPPSVILLTLQGISTRSATRYF